MAFKRDETWSKNYSQAEPHMNSAYNRGMSFNAFYEQVKGTHISYRRENMLTDWREVAGLYKYEWSLRQMPGDQQVRLNQTVEARGEQRSNFLATVEYQFLDAETGKYEPNARLIASSELLEKDEYVRLASEWLEPGGAYYDPSITGIRLRIVRRAQRVPLQ